MGVSSSNLRQAELQATVLDLLLDLVDLSACRRGRSIHLGGSVIGGSQNRSAQAIWVCVFLVDPRKLAVFLLKIPLKKPNQRVLSKMTDVHVNLGLLQRTVMRGGSGPFEQERLDFKGFFAA